MLQKFKRELIAFDFLIFFDDIRITAEKDFVLHVLNSNHPPKPMACEGTA